MQPSHNGVRIRLGRVLLACLTLTGCGGAQVTGPVAPGQAAGSGASTAHTAPPSVNPARLGEATVERCTMTGPALALGTDTALRVASGADGSLYVLDESGSVRRYIASNTGPCVLEHDANFGDHGTLDGRALVGQVVSIAADRDGNLYLAGSSAVVRLSHGEPTARCDVGGALTVAPSGEMGLAMVSWEEAANVLRFHGTECTTSVWSPEFALSSGDTLSILSDDLVAVSHLGLSLVNASGHARAVVIAGVDAEDIVIAQPTRAVPCGEGMCVLDAQNMSVLGYDAQHHHVGSANFRDHLRVPLTWIIDMTATVGSSLIISALEQANPSSPHYDASFFRIKAALAPSQAVEIPHPPLEAVPTTP